MRLCDEIRVLAIEDKWVSIVHFSVLGDKSLNKKSPNIKRVQGFHGKIYFQDVTGEKSYYHLS